MQPEWRRRAQSGELKQCRGAAELNWECGGRTQQCPSMKTKNPAVQLKKYTLIKDSNAIKLHPSIFIRLQTRKPWNSHSERSNTISHIPTAALSLNSVSSHSLRTLQQVVQGSRPSSTTCSATHSVCRMLIYSHTHSISSKGTEKHLVRRWPG